MTISLTPKATHNILSNAMAQDNFSNENADFRLFSFAHEMRKLEQDVASKQVEKEDPFALSQRVIALHQEIETATSIMNAGLKAAQSILHMQI